MDASPDQSSSEQPSNRSSDAPDAPEAPPSDASEAPRRRLLPAGVSWLGAATAGGGLVLAVVGLASLSISRDNGVSALDARLAGVELGLRELASRAPPAAADPKALDDVAGRVAKLEAAGATPPPAVSDPALANRVAALEGELKTMAETVGILGRRGDEALAAARDARARADATAAALAELAQKLPAASAAERSELDALADRVAAVERSEKTAASGDRAVRLALAATALDAAVERGDAFGAELATAKVLGADLKLVAALEPFARSGVPAAAALARQFSELAPSLLQAAGAPAREGVLGKLQMNAEKLVRIRRVDEVAGSDGGAIVARSEAKVSRGDLSGALAELAQLPPEARAPAEAWIKMVQARTAAIEASRRLAADALSGLSR
jgi:hypothetical protein